MAQSTSFLSFMCTWKKKGIKVLEVREKYITECASNTKLSEDIWKDTAFFFFFISVLFYNKALPPATGALKGLILHVTPLSQGGRHWPHGGQVIWGVCWLATTPQGKEGQLAECKGVLRLEWFHIARARTLFPGGVTLCFSLQRSQVAMWYT